MQKLRPRKVRFDPAYIFESCALHTVLSSWKKTLQISKLIPEIQSTYFFFFCYCYYFLWTFKVELFLNLFKDATFEVKCPHNLVGMLCTQSNKDSLYKINFLNIGSFNVECMRRLTIKSGDTYEYIFVL